MGQLVGDARRGRRSYSRWQYHTRSLGGGLSAYYGGGAFQCVIRNIEGENFFVGLGRANDVSVREHHEYIPLSLRPRPLAWLGR
jgi:hypothetical protein